jgi:hypothetical protein
MPDHTGRRRTRHEDAFRALDQYCDDQHFTHVSIVETPKGLLVKGYALSELTTAYHLGPVNFRFSNADIDVLLEEAAERWGKKPAASADDGGA